MPTLDLKGTHHFYTTKFLSIGTSINTMFCKWCDKPQLKLHCIAFYFVSILYLDELGNFFVFVPYNQSVIFDQRILTSLLIQPLYTSTYLCRSRFNRGHNKVFIVFFLSVGGTLYILTAFLKENLKISWGHVPPYGMHSVRPDYVLELLLNPDCLHLIWLTHTRLAENVSENHIILINSSYL